MDYRTRFRTRLLCSAGLALFFPAGLAAQDTDITKLPAAEPAAEEQSAAEPSVDVLRAGPFRIDGTATVRETFSDNIFVTKNDRESDWITGVSVGASARAAGEASQFTLRGGVNLGRYARFGSEDYDDFYAGGDGRFRIGKATSIFGGARYDWKHESRESPEDVNGVLPTRYRTGDYYAGLLQRFPSLTLRAGAALNTFDFDDVDTTAGAINNTDRNRTELEAGARLNYRLGKAAEPFVQAYWDKRDYESGLDDFGFRRESSGYRAAVGISGKLTPFLQGEAYAGAISQTYEDARFAEILKPDFGARLTWRPVAGTQLVAFVDRSLEETTLIGSPGYLRTALGASIEHEARPDLLLNAHFYYSENDYQGLDRLDHISDAGLGLKYVFARHLFAAVDYSFLHRISTTAPADFYENRVSFRLGAQLAPAYRSDPESFAPLSGSGLPGGFYIGVLAGHGALMTALDGPRGSGGSLTADFGADGWQGDVALGYGGLIGRTYLGIEADASLNEQSWRHDGEGGLRVYGVRKLQSYEIAARMGYELDGKALLYGRFGGVAAEFATSYVHNLQAVRPADFQRGLRFGGGVDFPVAGGLSGRMEFTRTSYEDYDVAAGRNADNFANDENLLRFGAIYGLAGARPQNPEYEVDYKGLYIGLQGGFGALMSENSGARNAPRILDVQRSGSGATGGVFAGYGYTLGALYFGAEAEAESSNANWNIERDPTGRVYSVQKSYAYGAGLRAGYVFNGVTLVYGRAGYVRTKFENNYQDEGGVNLVTPHVARDGLRIGGGVETPLSKSMMLRLDYTVTEYESYAVDYVTGVDTFRNSEDLFRTGILFRF